MARPNAAERPLLLGSDGSGRSPSPVPGLDRGLDVLECLASAAEPLTLTAIARALGRTVSEIQRTLAQLTLRAYLVRDDHGGYRLSSKLFRLANSHPPFRDLVARALGPMQRFADATNESVHLGVLSDDQLLLVAQAEGRALVRVTLEVGRLQPAVTTVSGRILLTGLDRREQVALFTRQRIAPSARKKLRAALAAIALSAHDYAESRFFRGVHDLGVPVALPDGRVIAALTTSWLQTRRGPSRVKELLGPLKAAARTIADAYEPSL